MASPIGFFDSGIGGLVIHAEVRRLLPEADLVYVADQAYLPYGGRTLEEVRARARVMTEVLLEEGAAVVVVACNSASAAALHHLRDRYPGTSFVGMEPAVRPAAGVTARGIVGVLATETTFRGELYADGVARHARDVAVVAQTCPGLAEAIEEEGPDGERTADLVDRYVGEVVARGADVVVLGCTHYSFVAERIRARAGVTVVDPATAVARQVVRVAGADGGGDGRSVFLTTGDPDRFADRLAELYGRRPPVGRLAR